MPDRCAGRGRRDASAGRGERVRHRRHQRTRRPRTGAGGRDDRAGRRGRGGRRTGREHLRPAGHRRVWPQRRGHHGPGGGVRRRAPGSAAGPRPHPEDRPARVLAHREAIVVAPQADGLATWRTGSRLAQRDHDSAVVLPGQGRVGDLTAAEAEIDGFRDVLAEALGCVPAADRPVVRGLLTGAPDVEAAPRHAELAVLVQSVAVARSLLADGLRPRSLCGFSLGEVAAGVVGGVLTLTEATAVVSERARILAGAPAGGMIRVRLPESSVQPYLGAGASVAIVPGRRSCMLSGEAAAIARDRRAAAPTASPASGSRSPTRSTARCWRTSTAAYTATWSQVDLRPPTLRLMSPTTGGWLDEATARDPGFWASHLVRTVRFGDAMDRLRADGVDLVHVLDADAGITPFVREAFGADTVAMATADRSGSTRSPGLGSWRRRGRPGTTPTRCRPTRTRPRALVHARRPTPSTEAPTRSCRPCRSTHGRRPTTTSGASSPSWWGPRRKRSTPPPPSSSSATTPSCSSSSPTPCRPSSTPTSTCDGCSSSWTRAPA